MKTISVIVPIYRVESYIEETVRSLLNQTYKDFELILVDDGSPDQSATKAEALLLDSAITDYKIIHTENRGVSAARNTGLELAKGRYVIMVDGDDALAPDFLESYIKLMNQYPGGDVYSTSFTICTDDRVIEQPKLNQDVMRYTAKEALVAFYHRTPKFLLPTLMLSREFVDNNNIRFDEGVRYSEDVQFIWRVLAYNRKYVTHSSYSGYKYILHSGSTMTASGVKKIMTWHNGFNRLDNDIHSLLPDEIRNSFVPMSYFAMLHGITKMLSYDSFKEVYKKTDSASRLRFKLSAVSFKIRFVSTITRCCPLLGYKILKLF